MPTGGRATGGSSFTGPARPRSRGRNERAASGLLPPSACKSTRSGDKAERKRGQRMSSIAQDSGHGMRRAIDWKHAFFVAAGVPALVLFSMGGISATIGAPAWLVWTISVVFGFVQSFIYAEIAGLHPSKSGGTAVHGATAWIRYSKFLAPLSLWCNWLAWTPVLAIGAGLGAGYLLSIFFAADNPINSWT